MMIKVISAACTPYTSRFCPHVALVAIATPTIWAALLYLLIIR